MLKLLILVSPQLGGLFTHYTFQEFISGGGGGGGSNKY